MIPLLLPALPRRVPLIGAPAPVTLMSRKSTSVPENALTVTVLLVVVTFEVRSCLALPPAPALKVKVPLTVKFESVVICLMPVTDRPTKVRLLNVLAPVRPRVLVDVVLVKETLLYVLPPPIKLVTAPLMVIADPPALIVVGISTVEVPAHVP